MKRALVLFVVLAIIWLLWSGMFEPLILTFGALSCAAVAALCARMRITDPEGTPFHLLGRVAVYIPWFLKEIVTSNLDVTRRVLARNVPVSPVLFETPASQQTDLGRVVFANSITLTPGTVACEIESDRILVHAIAKEVAEGVLSGEMDRRCTWVEGAP